MPQYYDRYKNFRTDDNKIKPLPGLFIESQSSDKRITYKVGETRLDKISNMYYNTPYFGWLIMSANGRYGGLEFNIPDQSIIIVPYPFESAMSRYISEVNKYNSLYGI